MGYALRRTMGVTLRCKCRKRDSNPHSHHWPRDFKSLVSTDSTIAAHPRCTLCKALAAVTAKVRLLGDSCRASA